MELCEKKWIITGVVFAILSCICTLLSYNSFFPGADYNGLLFAVTLLAGLCGGAALAFSPIGGIRLLKTDFRKFWSWLVFLACPFLNVIAVERLNGNFITELINNDYIDNYVICLLIYLVIFALSGSLKLPVFMASPLLLLFGTINMYVMEFKGTPFLPMDLKSIGTAAAVAGGYTYRLHSDFVFAAVITAFTICLAIHIYRPLKGRLVRMLRCISILIPITGAFLFYCTDSLVSMGYKPDLFNETRGFQNKGAILEFTMDTRYIWMRSPEGYDASEVAGLVKKGIGSGSPSSASEETTSEEKKPDIIVIMDESFSDLRVNGDFDTNKEFMPFIDSLSGEDDVIEGDAYVSVLGTGTSNTEYEFLTGDSMAFLPAASNAYQLYVEDRQPGLVSTLKSQGYFTMAFHPYFGSNWNRENVYTSMGFGDYISMEDIFGSSLMNGYRKSGYSSATLRALLRQRYPDKDPEDILYRQYVSDDYDFSYIEDAYEGRDKDQPFFMFNVTMQNHSPYDHDIQPEVQIKGSEGEYPKAEQYLTCIRHTDEALEKLIGYFQKKDDPVIILFFGDHQPNIETEFIDDISGKSQNEMTDQEIQNRYKTRFVLWANYDIPEGHVDKISMNYLQTTLLETAGLEMPDYEKYLAQLYKDIPVITAAGCIDSKGNYFKESDRTGISSRLRDKLDSYNKIAYNNTFGGKDLAEGVFYINKNN